MNDARELIFVYGTLRRRASNHWRMEGAEALGDGWVRGRLYVIDWYPGLVLDEDGGRVRGELYRVERAHLERLDEFEGLGAGEQAEYARVQAEVFREDGPVLMAWVYDYRGEVAGRKEVLPADWVRTDRGGGC